MNILDLFTMEHKEHPLGPHLTIRTKTCRGKTFIFQSAEVDLHPFDQPFLLILLKKYLLLVDAQINIMMKLKAYLGRFG